MCACVCVIHQSVNDHNQKFGSLDGGGGDTLSVIVCIRSTHVASSSSCTCRLFPFRSKPNCGFPSNLWLFLFRIQTNSTVSQTQSSQNWCKRDEMIFAKKFPRTSLIHLWRWIDLTKGWHNGANAHDLFFCQIRTWSCKCYEIISRNFDQNFLI